MTNTPERGTWADHVSIALGATTPRTMTDRVTGRPATIYTPPEDLVAPHAGSDDQGNPMRQPVERQLYRFWAEDLILHEEQPHVGWWRRSNETWHAVFGDGIWSGHFVTRWEPVELGDVDAEAKVARVEALAEEWWNDAEHNEDAHPGAARAVFACVREVRDALAGPEATEGGA